VDCGEEVAFETDCYGFCGILFKSLFHDLNIAVLNDIVGSFVT
jgi:hypothetical protein